MEANRRVHFKTVTLTLEKQHKTHPLIVFMIFNFIFTIDMWANAGLHNVFSDDSRKTIGNGEGRINPTICIHHIERDFIDNTVDRISDVLTRSHQKRESNQNDHCRFVMQPKNIIVDAYLIKFQKPLHGAEHIKHFGFFFSLTSIQITFASYKVQIIISPFLELWFFLPQKQEKKTTPLKKKSKNKIHNVKLTRLWSFSNWALEFEVWRDCCSISPYFSLEISCDCISSV